MARPVSVTVTEDTATIEGLVESLHELAAAAAVKMQEKLESDQRPRQNGLSARSEHLYWSGILQGLCMSIGTATGESTDDLVHRHQQKAGAR